MRIEQAGLGRASKFIAARFIPEGDFREWGEIEAWATAIAHELRTSVARRRVTATRKTSGKGACRDYDTHIQRDTCRTA